MWKTFYINYCYQLKYWLNTIVFSNVSSLKAINHILRFSNNCMKYEANLV